MTTTANVDPLDYLQGMLARGVPPLARYTQPGAPVLTLVPAPAHDDLPTVMPTRGWLTWVARQPDGLYRVVAKSGSRVQTVRDLTYADVETFDADERWSRPAPRLERLLGR